MTIADEIQWRDPKIQLRNVTILKGCELLCLSRFPASGPVKFLEATGP